MPKMRKPFDLKVSPLRLIDDPMRHEGHRQAARGLASSVPGKRYILHIMSGFTQNDV
jgi:hypothetical protein